MRAITLEEMIELSPDYSTTRLVTCERPVIEEPPDAAFETVLFLPEGEGRQGEGGLRAQGYFKRSLPEKPLITVITVVFNGAQYLEETILSVIRQTYDNVEYIIIDGGSTDGTLDIIRKYVHAIDYWVSEKDGGIYDAMNKAIRLSSGQLINFMNCGDQFKKGFQPLFVNKFDNNSIFSFSIEYTSGKIFIPRGGFAIYLKNSLHHQGTFYQLHHYKKYGLYDLKYKILADYHFNLTLYCNDVNILCFQDIFASTCQVGGLSDTPNSVNYREEIEIRRFCIQHNLIIIVLSIYSIVRFFFKRIARWIPI